ncbi:hypothetical protein C1646_730581 [Rhizophagus diaphanus]|nr:hypothetical protein C1646_730581 [Rhizophagus diaphanus] [Rhizophagus sp. MUCL 43196]
MICNMCSKTSQFPSIPFFITKTACCFIMTITMAFTSLYILPNICKRTSRIFFLWVIYFIITKNYYITLWLRGFFH